MISPDSNGLYHPNTEQDIIDLVQFAVKNKLQVRVRGAAQSVNAAIYTDGFSLMGPGTNINMELDRMRSVSFDETNMQVTVGGGCNLAWDPFDPSGTSKTDNTNNLYFQLNQKGWSLQNVPDAAHQTIAGFISTGSQGGSMTHSFDDCIVAIRLIDGTGTAKTFTRSEDPDNPFFAIGVSIGLLGVITSVTLQCVPAFNIIGQEKVTPQDQCDFDFFGEGNAEQLSLKDYLSSTEFARMLWWPYPTLKRMIAWKARTMQPSDYNQQTGIPPDFKPNPYSPVFPKLFGSTLPAEAVAGTGYRVIANYPQWLYDIFGNSKDWAMIKPAVDALAPYLYPFMINMYFPMTTDKNPPKQFRDYWNGSLPMDTIEFSNNMMSLVYTEFWISADNARLAVNTLNDYYQSQGNSLVSYYTVEVLGAKRSNFWLSPSYGHDTIRLNLMRFDVNTSADINYYQIFWDLFKEKDIPFRLHWGKFLPPASTNENPAYFASRYPRWNDFLKLRSQMDPDNVFLNSYWKSQLGI